MATLGPLITVTAVVGYDVRICSASDTTDSVGDWLKMYDGVFIAFSVSVLLHIGINRSMLFD
jgi:hypothetical protein